MDVVNDMLKKYILKTDSARIWEQKSWHGNKLCIVKNSCTDLKIMFIQDAGEEDTFEIPSVTFGGKEVIIWFDANFNQVFLNHSAVADGEITIIVGTGKSIYFLSV